MSIAGSVKSKHERRRLLHPLLVFAFYGALCALLLFLPLDNFVLRLLTVFLVLLAFPVTYYLQYHRLSRRLRPIRTALELLNRGKLEDLRLMDPERQMDRTAVETELESKLVLLSLNVQGLLDHLTHIAANIRTVSGAIDEQLITYIHDVKHQITNTDVTLQSADEIQGFIREISSNVDSLNSIAAETLTFLKEIVQSNENVTIKMESLSAYATDTEESMRDIIAHTRQVNENTENLASMVVETSTSVMEMDATISEIRRQAHRTLDAARDAMHAATAGLDQTRETNTSVEQAGQRFEQVSQKIRELKESSHRIGEIINTVQKISDQTGLLALNATIYASGEDRSDRDTGIVAEKIRELANSSLLAMKEVRMVLTGMQQLVDEGHDLVQDGDKVVKDGVSQVHETTRQLEQIAEKLESVNMNIASVSAATDEHSEGSAQVARATQQISVMTEEIASLTSRQTDIVERVSGKARFVGQLVTGMKKMVQNETAKTHQLLDHMKDIGHETRRVLNQSEELELNNRKILNAIRNIREITDSNYRNTAVLSRSSVSLDKYAWLLSKRLETFEQAKPQSGGTLRIGGIALVHNSLDPHHATTVQDAQIISMVHAGLVKYDSLFNLIPDVARGWDVSQDGREYVFHLRDKVRFHNGQQLTASDVVNSMKRLLDPAFNCPMSGLFHVIEGADTFSAGASDELSGVTAVDERTVRFTLSRPLVFFADLLALSYAAILPQTAYLNGPETSFTEFGCGPFKVARFTRNKQLVLRRHDDYHRGERPHVSKLVLDMEGRQQALEQFRNGHLDLVSINEPQELAAAEADPGLREHVITATQLSTYFLAFNCRQSPVNRADVRQALSLAIDRQEICRTFPLEMAEPAWCILPPGLLGHNPSSFRTAYDPEKSRWILEQGAFDFQTPIAFTFAQLGPDLPVDVQVVAENLRAIGLRVEFNGMEQHWPHVEAREHTMFRVGWVADYPDSDNFMYSLFHSAAGDPLFTGFSDPDVDRLTQKARFTMDPRERVTAYEQVERILAERTPIIPLYHKREAVVKSPHLGRVALKGFTPFLDVEDIWFHRL